MTLLRERIGQKAGGGVAAYISHKYTEGQMWRRRTDLEVENIETMWIEFIPPKSKSFLLCVVYRPPDGSRYLYDNFSELFNDQLTKGVNNGRKEVILMGDINVDFLKRNCHENIKTILQVNGLKQLVKSATRITEHSTTLIDIITSNNPTNIRETVVIPAAYSDHDMVGCIRKINHIKYEPKLTTTRNYARYDHAAMSNDLKAINWDPVLKSKNVEEAVELFNDLLTDVFNRHAPFTTKRVKGKATPWIDREIRDCMDRRDKLLRRGRKYKDPNDWLLYKSLRNQCTNRLRAARKAYHHNLLNENKDNPKKF